MPNATMPNATMSKFGYPGTLIAETTCWAVLLRPLQPTLGALVLVCKEPAASFGSLSAGAFAELGPTVGGIEAMLATFTAYEKINYLMLMMVDPDVHFHVVPRYGAPRSYAGLSFPDAGWPGQPALGAAVEPDAATLAALTGELRAIWAKTGEVDDG